MQSKAKGKGNLSVLMDYAGRRRVLTYLSWGLSAVSALTALVPFIFVWLIVREVIEADGNFAAVQGSLSVYGWWAVGSALISMLVYFAALMCSHVAAFRVAGNMRKKAMRHIGTLPVGFMNSLGSGRVAALQGSLKLLDDSLQSGLGSLVLLISNLRQFHTLLCGLDVGHGHTSCSVFYLMRLLIIP